MIQRRFGIVLKLLFSIIYGIVLYADSEKGSNQHFSDALTCKDECTIFQSASFSSLLKVFQFQGFRSQSGEKLIEKHSRQQNGSRRMAGSDELLIHSISLVRQLVRYSVRVMALTEDRMSGFWRKNWWSLWQVWSLLRVILENSFLRLGRRNEEETRAHCLSKWVSSPTATIILSMMSCGISTDFAICAFDEAIDEVRGRLRPVYGT